MAFPTPQLGMVVSYAYLWRHEHRAGRDEGVKNRPCVIVLASEAPSHDATLVRVAAVTHRPPVDPSVAFELPLAVKRHLGLDDARSWVVLDEVNEFAWPGFDLRPIGRGRNDCVYGLLPPRLFEQIMTRIRAVWMSRPGRAISRD